jgi:hypothetical protein
MPASKSTFSKSDSSISRHDFTCNAEKGLVVLIVTTKPFSQNARAFEAKVLRLSVSST